ncbi:mediator of RNA polymerase II transcription subunit 26-like [Uloborus diversus]|uniref:mediator of RNA polymerase II transcription subunit 26-like n=1 Tax=Uloborus diversus TaxID=327109 RepID=UPI00240922C9|nr:mediator of RNA polymerase II transcription subunit 26-like [Uloborus diversus]
MQTSPYEIKEKLLQALDHEYNVVDMAAVMEVITALEKVIITKEALEKTRIGRYINELRKRTTNEQLARRAKDLVKSWRKLLPQTPQRINGEEIVINIRPSPGNIPVLGPGPGPGFGPGPGPGNRTSKNTHTCISVPGTPRYKTLSPSMMGGERSSSPYFSSASNSPLLNSSVHQGSSLPSMPSNYAPVKFVSCNSATKERGEKVNSINKSLLNSSNQSKNVTSSHMFQPVSPSFASVKEISSIEYNNTYSGTIILPSTQRIDSPNLSPGHKTNSSSSSPSITIVNLCSQPATPTIACSATHSTLDIAKTNVANKRLRKENTFSNCTSLSLKELDNSNSNSKIGNGTSDIDEVILISDSNALTNDNFMNSDSVDTDVQIISKTSNSKTPKRKRSLDKIELQESRLNEMIASLPSGSKHPKVKTTQQLIADLQAKKGFSSLLSADNLSSVDSLHASDAEVSRTKSELLKKFLIASQSVRHDSNHESPTDESSVSIISDCGSHSVPDVSSVINTNFGNSTSISHTDPVDEDINRILSALPPINVSEINIEDEMPSPKRPVSVSSDDLNRLSKPWEYVTGVFDCDGTWRPWQECTEQKSVGESFKILPYVNID